MTEPSSAESGLILAGYRTHPGSARRATADLITGIDQALEVL